MRAPASPRTGVLGHFQLVLSKLANKSGLMCSNPLIVRNRVNLKENRVGLNGSLVEICTEVRAKLQVRPLRSPRFPVQLSGVGELRAASRWESRIRPLGWYCDIGNPGPLQWDDKVEGGGRPCMSGGGWTESKKANLDKSDFQPSLSGLFWLLSSTQDWQPVKAVRRMSGVHFAKARDMERFAFRAYLKCFKILPILTACPNLASPVGPLLRESLHWEKLPTTDPKCGWGIKPAESHQRNGAKQWQPR